MSSFDPLKQTPPRRSTDEIPETPGLARKDNTHTRSLPIRTQPTQETDNLHNPQHVLLVEARLAGKKNIDTELLSMGVLLIRASTTYSELVAAIEIGKSNWEHVPSNYSVRRISVRWELGQDVEDCSYDTVCGPEVKMDRLILMMRERQWKDRLVVVLDPQESNSGSGDEPKARQSSPILGDSEDGE